MSNALKIVLNILHNRILRKCETKIGHDQFGFRGGMGTRKADRMKLSKLILPYGETSNRINIGKRES